MVLSPVSSGGPFLFADAAGFYRDGEDEAGVGALLMPRVSPGSGFRGGSLVVSHGGRDGSLWREPVEKGIGMAISGPQTLGTDVSTVLILAHMDP
jgi:hypothetical protein